MAALEPWEDLALCKEVDLEIFFPAKGGDVRPAQRVCRLCPVVDDCLNYALETEQPHGIWGGWTARRRSMFLNRLRAA